MLVTSRAYEEAWVELLRKDPFYAYVLMSMKKRINPNLKDAYAGVGPVGTSIELHINPELFDPLPLMDRVIVLEHEVLHVIFAHFLRKENRNHGLWNVATDCAINSLLRSKHQQIYALGYEPSVFGLPEGKAAEWYYERLKENTVTITISMEDLENIHPLWQQQGDGTSAGGSDVLQRLSDEYYEQLIKDVVRRSLEHARQEGKQPGELQQFLAEFLKSPNNWRRIMRLFISHTSKLHKYATWKKTNRRFDLDFPGWRRQNRLRLVVAIDTSGSISDKQLNMFISELANIKSQTNSEIYVIECDTRIHNEYEYKNNFYIPKFKARGGTDLRPPFKRALSMRPKVDGLIYLTDGIGPAPKTQPLPTLWALTKQHLDPAPWGFKMVLEEYL